MKKGMQKNPLYLGRKKERKQRKKEGGGIKNTTDSIKSHREVFFAYLNKHIIHKYLWIYINGWIEARDCLAKSPMPGMGNLPSCCWSGKSKRQYRPLPLLLVAAQNLMIRSYFWRHHTILTKVRKIKFDLVWKPHSSGLALLVSESAIQAAKRE